jgi:hypothetical protein
MKTHLERALLKSSLTWAGISKMILKVFCVALAAEEAWLEKMRQVWQWMLCSPHLQWCDMFEREVSRPQIWALASVCALYVIEVATVRTPP